MSNVGGTLLDVVRRQVTAAANLAAKTFVNADGSVPASAAACTGGVVLAPTASGDIADVFLPPDVVPCLATGTVTDGLEVELLQASVYDNISGTKTAITAAGVSILASGYKIGRAIGSGVAGDTVLIQLYGNQAK
jgi:hypothetical protein